jgi:hypothetical protein
MSRYFTQPRANLPLYVEQLWGNESFKPHLDVPDHEATDTGLLDHRGDTIMRAPNPMGFQAKL